MIETISYFASLPILEVIAVITALIYVILAAKGHMWCWPAALVSTLLYTVIFYDVYLWMDSLLQIYYMVMAVYGWYCWQKGTSKTNKQIQGVSITISQWAIKNHLVAIVLLALLSVLLGWFMSNNTPTDFPYIDAATTVFAVFATYLVTQKVLENWLYWLVIDFISIYIYIQKGLTPTAVLFVLYLILATYGYYHWLQILQQQKQAESSV